MKNVLGIEEFTLDHITSARGSRRPPVVMTREEVRSVFARLEDPLKLIARYHLHDDSMARQIRDAARKAAIPKRITSHTLRQVYS